MRLSSQVQLLRSGDKEKGAFRNQTTSALPCSTTASHSRRTEGSTSARFPEGCMKGGQVALDSNISGLCRPRRHSSVAWLLGTVHLLECPLHAGRTRHHPGWGAGHGVQHHRHPNSPTGHPAVPLLSTTTASPGKPHCHLLSHHTWCVAVPAPGQSEQGCRFEPSLSCHVGWAGQKTPKLRKSSDLAHKSRCDP